jgi:DNA-binding NarL/FixJ family response regulator
MNKLPPPQHTVTKNELDALQAMINMAQKRLNEQPIEAAIAPETNNAPPGWHKLKPREQAVVRLIAEGYTTAQIAEIRHQSPDAIHSQRRSICQKLGLSGADCLLRFAERNRTWLLR